ncbi:hypothetical protein JCM10449v2_002765 [Rhodotorula kratochvilovae]
MPAHPPTAPRPCLAPLVVSDPLGAPPSQSALASPLSLDAFPAPRGTTTATAGTGWAWSPPRARRALSDEGVLLLGRKAAGRGVQHHHAQGWYVGGALDGLAGDEVRDGEGAGDGAAAPYDGGDFASSLSLTGMEALPSPHEHGQEHEDDEGASFVALAALHDPALFASPSAVVDGPQSLPSSPTTLEISFGSRGRRHGRLEAVDEWGRREAIASRERDMERAREASLARSVCEASWSKRVGAKAEASVGLQAESASSSPVLAASPALSASPPTSHAQHGRRRSATVSTGTADAVARSPATDSLARFASTSAPVAKSVSPTTPSSPPRRGRFKRRYSTLETPPAVDQHDPLALPLAVDTAVHRPSLVPKSRSAVSPAAASGYGSLASLSRYLDSGRRSSLPSGTASSGSSTPSPSATPSPSSAAAAAASGGSALDLRALAAGSYRALASALHLSPPGSPLSPSSAAPGAEQLVAWESVRALRVRFRPAASAADGGALNAWLLGLTDLSLGGARAWDPRSGAPAEKLAARERGRWPTVSASVGSPPCVEVEFVGGGRREFDPRGMAQEEIMRAVLVPPAPA